jgi:hypothetical protein
MKRGTLPSQLTARQQIPAARGSGQPSDVAFTSWVFNGWVGRAIAKAVAKLKENFASTRKNVARAPRSIIAELLLAGAGRSARCA